MIKSYLFSGNHKSRMRKYPSFKPGSQMTKHLMNIWMSRKLSIQWADKPESKVIALSWMNSATK